LEVLYSPNIEGNNGKQAFFTNIAFSEDGKQLAAGGHYNNGWRMMRIWTEAGKGSYKDYIASSSTINDIEPLPLNKFVYCGSEWGVIDPTQASLEFLVMPEVNSYASYDRSNFRLSTGGLEVGALSIQNRIPFQFSIPERRLALLQSPHDSALASRDGLIVTNWKNSNPKLNGKAIDLPTETRSVDIASGRQGIVFGGNSLIYVTDANGVLRWKSLVPSEAWAVKIENQNQIVAAAIGDGTIRWYRFDDGGPLLSLYLHPDNQRWVLWTPSGYYDCSPGAEDLIGCHVNNGPDSAANYYPISRFRDTYYRPDVIDQVLIELDEKKAVTVANINANRRRNSALLRSQLPPTVRILSPTSGSEVKETNIKLEYQLESPLGEEVTNLIVQIDGRPIKFDGRGLKPVGRKLEIYVTIPQADCSLSIIAENRIGTSEAATIHLQWKGIKGVEIWPKLYALVVGINDYSNSGINDLDYAAKDAEDFAITIEKQKGLLYQDVQVNRLIGANATKDNILDGLDR
ncbi:MAG: hypothetical protein WBO32_03095, partial [Cyclobacteriaceae bacterium]